MSDHQAKSFVNPTAHLVYEALTQLGWDIGDPKAVAEKVRQLSLGLPAEDELAVILTWLGNCRLIHKLDQVQTPPTRESRYRVPDLLAIFDHGDREIPVLIEVKASKGRQLSWRPGYFEQFRRYGQALGVPVLVAWKATSVGTWFLVDMDRFERPNRDYKLTFEAAAKGNLLGVLGGDFMVDLPPGLGMRLEFDKVRTLAKEAQEGHALEEVLLEVSDASFLTPSGERLKSLGPGLWPLFWATGPVEETIETENGYQLNVHIPPHGLFTWAHVTLTTLLTFRTDAASPDTPFPWRERLRTRNFPITSSALLEAAGNGIKQGTVRYILHQQPDIMPTFLGDTV